MMGNKTSVMGNKTSVMGNNLTVALPLLDYPFPTPSV